MPFNFYDKYGESFPFEKEPLIATNIDNKIKELVDVELEGLEKLLWNQIPEYIDIADKYRGGFVRYFIRETVKKLMDERITTEEAEYLRYTKVVNDLKNQINEAEKEKIELRDRIHALDKKIDEIGKEYSAALDNMLTASAKVK
jgi:chromosome segregation ATPase